MWSLISFFGSLWWILIVSFGLVFYLLFKKRNKVALYYALIMSISPIISDTLKLLVQEPRPNGLLENGFSFPSGHAFNSIVFYLLLKRILKVNKYLIWVMIILVGVSRVVLGAHYWWDVLGGWAIGYLYYQVSIKLVK